MDLRAELDLRLKMLLFYHFQFNPVMPSVYALGTYSRHLGVYVEPLTLVCMHEGQQKGGITHVQFSPDGTKLLAGGRKDKEILVWDLRNPGKGCSLMTSRNGLGA